MTRILASGDVGPTSVYRRSSTNATHLPEPETGGPTQALNSSYGAGYKRLTFGGQLIHTVETLPDFKITRLWDPRPADDSEQKIVNPSDDEW